MFDHCRLWVLGIDGGSARCPHLCSPAARARGRIEGGEPGSPPTPVHTHTHTRAQTQFPPPQCLFLSLSSQSHCSLALCLSLSHCAPFYYFSFHVLTLWVSCSSFCPFSPPPLPLLVLSSYCGSLHSPYTLSFIYFILYVYCIYSMLRYTRAYCCVTAANSIQRRDVLPRPGAQRPAPWNPELTGLYRLGECASIMFT